MDSGPRLTRLVLIRHAEAVEARGNPQLSELGIRQAKLLGDRALKTGELRMASRLLASDLIRASETAKVIARAVGADGLEVQEQSDLREMSWGDGDALPEAEASDHQARARNLFPDPEVWSEFEQQARSALKRCAELASGSTVVVVCHTGVIEASFIEFAGLRNRSQRFAMRPRNASITTWVTAGSDIARRSWRLEGYNDAAHLWVDGALWHGPEDFHMLVSGCEPFWAAMEARRVKT